MLIIIIDIKNDNYYQLRAVILATPYEVGVTVNIPNLGVKDLGTGRSLSSRGQNSFILSQSPATA